ncbi:hypothetical protein [Calycomorphotria hydatis]|uniref:Uncharacterized protein n=1 Tax=Calycomorphotria hydatis TaxID=2528027 RepID=A0A517T7S4_9PLAN|nr:hypothetical protein [Calycomorphotria hydatis]QDT64423.1 hypothetical protein V22_16570 [Calycomorphotria hydatis]
MLLFIFSICVIGGLIGLLTATQSKQIRVVAIFISPFVTWFIMLVYGAIESLMTGVIARGIGGVLMISLGYWLFFAWSVALTCFLVQIAVRRFFRFKSVD